MDHLNQEQVQRNFSRSALVVRSGIDINKFPFSLKTHQSETIHLYSTGIFFQHRRIEDTVKAMSILTQKGYQVILNHVGSDDLGMSYARKIYSLVSDMGLSDKVFFYKRVSDQKLIQLFQAVEVRVF